MPTQEKEKEMSGIGGGKPGRGLLDDKAPSQRLKELKADGAFIDYLDRKCLTYDIVEQLVKDPIIQAVVEARVKLIAITMRDKLNKKYGGVTIKLKRRTKITRTGRKGPGQ